MASMRAAGVASVQAQDRRRLNPARGVAMRAAAGPAPAGASPAAPPPLNRRQQLLATAALLIATQPWGAPSQAADDAPAAAAAGQVYVDAIDAFSLSVPAGWVQGGGALDGSNGQAAQSRYSNAAGLQRVVAWAPPGQGNDVSVAVTIRTPSADFTSLGSFGTAQDFGQNIVASMDRSFVARQPEWARRGQTVTTAALVSAVDSGDGRYVIEYEVGKEGGPTRRIVSAVALGTTPRGLRRFYTVTASCTEGEAEGRYQEALRAAVASFAAPASA